MNRTMADAREYESNGYRVEVSGWDAEERFFVEKSTLIWSEKTGKRVALQAVVQAGSVLFVRLTQPMGGGSGFPVPYRAGECELNRGAAGRSADVGAAAAADGVAGEAEQFIFAGAARGIGSIWEFAVP